MTLHLTRRAALKSLTAAAALAATGRSAFADATPIKLGFVGPLSGAQQVLGDPMLKGAKIAIAQINKAGGVNGRPLELVARDDKASGADAAAGARDLFGQDVKLLFGAIQTASALGMMPLLAPNDATLISCAAVADSLTHESFVPNYFRISDNSYMRYRGLARVMAEKYPEITSWTGVFPDAAYGHSSWDAFRDGLKTFYPEIAKKDVKIIDPVLTKFGATDYKPQVTTLMQTAAEGVFNNTNGADAVTLLAQGANFGMSRKFKAIADGANEFNVPKALGRRMIPNFWTAMHWHFGGYQNTAMGKQLYEDYVAETGDKFPLGYVEQGHAAVYAYADALKKNGGKTEGSAIVATLEGLSFDTAKGKRTFRKEDHQAILDINFIEINPKDNDLGWSVDQFVRIDGAELIEPPSPGKPIVYAKL